MSSTPLRGFRAEDELWDEAKRIAKANGDSLSEILRQALARYVNNNQDVRFPKNANA